MNQNIQQAKSDQKGKAITSLMVGIITGILIVIRIVLPSLALAPGPSVLALFAIIITWLIPFFSLIGLILGITGLKSTKRNFAIIGILLSVVGLLAPLVGLLFF